METVLKAGASIDVLSPSDLREVLREMLDDMREVREPASVFDIELPIVATGAGVVVLTQIFDIPMGYACTIHRLHIMAAGATPLAPLAAGYLYFSRNDDSPMNVWGFVPPVGTTAVAPYENDWGGDAARFIRGGSGIMVYGAGFAANQRLYVTMQIKLEKWEDKPS